MIYIPRRTFTVWGTPCHYDPQTELEYLVMKYPNKPWSYENLAKNPNISMEFIEKNFWFREKIRKYAYYLSLNPNITIDFINKYYSCFDGSSFLPEARGLYIYLPKWNWAFLSMNVNMTKKIIEDTLDIYPWDFESLIKNPNIDSEFVYEHYNEFPSLRRKTHEELVTMLDNRLPVSKDEEEDYYGDEFDIINKKFADFDYRQIDSTNNDASFWGDLSLHLFNYENVFLYHDRRKSETVEHVKQYKEELFQVTWSFENLKNVMDETEYNDLLGRWNHSL